MVTVHALMNSLQSVLMAISCTSEKNRVAVAGLPMTESSGKTVNMPPSLLVLCLSEGDLLYEYEKKPTYCIPRIR